MVSYIRSAVDAVGTAITHVQQHPQEYKVATIGIAAVATFYSGVKAAKSLGLENTTVLATAGFLALGAATAGALKLSQFINGTSGNKEQRATAQPVVTQPVVTQPVVTQSVEERVVDRLMTAGQIGPRATATVTAQSVNLTTPTAARTKEQLTASARKASLGHSKSALTPTDRAGRDVLASLASIGKQASQTSTLKKSS